MINSIIAQDSSNSNNNQEESNTDVTLDVPCEVPESRFNIQVNKRISLSYSITTSDVTRFKKTKAYQKDDYKNLTDDQLLNLQGKPKLGFLVSIYNSPKHWETVKVTIDELKALVDAGHTIRGSIKEGGNAKKNVKYGSTMWLDIDEGQSIEDTKKNPWTKHAFMLYPSPSFTEENQKHRLGFRLSRDANVEDLELAYFALLDFYKNGDKSTKDAGRLFYGTSREAEILSYDATLPVDELIEYGKSLKQSSKKSSRQSSVNNINSKSSTPVDKKVVSTGGVAESNSSELINLKDGDNTFFRRVDKDCYDKIFIGICGGDINKFTCFYDHNVTPWTDESDKLEHWRMSAFGGDGTRVNVFIQEGHLLPTFVDLKRDGKGCNWVEYALVGLKYNKILPEDTTMHGENWDVIVSLFYEQFGLTYNREDFELKPEEIETFKKNIWLSALDYFENVIAKDYIKQAKNDKTGETFLYFDLELGYWDYTSSVNLIFSRTVYPLIESQIITPLANEYGVYIPDAFDFIEYHKVNKMTLFKVIKTRFERKPIFPTIKDLVNFVESRKEDVIPLANGDWNWRTKEFTPNFDPNNNNQSRYDRLYNPDYSSRGIDALNAWLDKIYDHQDQRDAVISWLVVNVAGVAYRTQKMLNIFGKRKTGKSTILNLIQALLGSQLCFPLEDAVFADGNKFSYQSFEGRYAVTIDEFNKPTVNAWNKLKKVTGNDDKLFMTVEHKGLKPVLTLFVGGITTVSQDMFKLNDSTCDEGVNRRITLLKHTEGKSTKEIKALADRLKSSETEIIDDLFMWCIHQDIDFHVKRFTDLSDNSPVFLQVKHEVKASNDRTLRFVDECIEITNDDKDRIPVSELQDQFKCFLMSEGLEVSEVEKTKVGNIINWFAKSVTKDNGYSWDFKPDSDVPYGSQKVCKFKTRDPQKGTLTVSSRGVKGMKFKPEALESLTPNYHQLTKFQDF